MARILVVDDSQDFCSVISAFLEVENHQVCCANGCEEGIQCLERQEFDIVFCDMVLPLSNHIDDFEEEGSALVGLNLIRSVKEKFPNLKIVAISGVADKSALLGLKKFGVDDILEKPFSRDDIVRIIEKFSPKEEAFDSGSSHL
ncbi:MAG: response regulator [Candidatus Dadabacteria bacterium]|nr:MAG: response regulator [Candidatus Dadabacteria bacterium]